MIRNQAELHSCTSSLLTQLERGRTLQVEDLLPEQGRLGDQAKCDSDTHGCPACAHTVVGPAIVGSTSVLVNNRPALRVGDTGVHAACCAAQTWTAAAGSSSVLINGKPAHRKDDSTTHCGGVGKLIEGSTNVKVGG